MRRANGFDALDAIDGLHPFAVRETRGDFLRDFRIFLELARLQISVNHHTRAETALGDDIGRVGHDITEDTNFRGDVDVIIGRAPEARRAQPVAVEAGAELLAIGEDEQRWTIPRFLHPSVIIVEIVNFRERRIEFRVVAVRFRHKQHHSLRRRAAGSHQELRDSVEVGGIGGSRITDRAEFRFTTAPDRVLHISFLRRHPVQVTLKGVDLTVVSQETHRLRERPLRRRVRGETAVVNRELRLVVGVFQILVELAQHRGSKHTLVHNRAGAQGANVEALSQHGVGARRLFARLARDEQLALELFAFQARPVDENLFVHRARHLRERTDDGVVHRNRTPTEHLEAFGDAARLKNLLRLSRLGTVGGQHNHTDRRGAFRESTDTIRRAPLVQKLPRNVRHDTDTITRVVVRRARPAVLHAPDSHQGIFHSLVRALTLQRSDETDPARIMLFQKLRVIHRTAFIHGPIAVHRPSLRQAHRLRAVASRHAHRRALGQRRGLTQRHRGRSKLLRDVNDHTLPSVFFVRRSIDAFAPRLRPVF